MTKLLRYQQVAEAIRAQIAQGVLVPGEPAPSGAALSRMTGYSVLTCRKALAVLIQDGVLVPGTSQTARARVAGPAATHQEHSVAIAIRTLSTALANYRHAMDLTQPELAAVVGKSVTTVGHAETGRVWQSRDFWEKADKALDAGGTLVALYERYRAATAGLFASSNAQESAAVVNAVSRTVGMGKARAAATEAMAGSEPVCVTITWGNGVVTRVYPPEG